LWLSPIRAERRIAGQALPQTAAGASDPAATLDPGGE
jgi:hypothetical protein